MRFTTMADCLRARACAHPERAAWIYLRDGEEESARLTYAQADRRAQAVAALLAGRGQPGERVLLLFPPGLDFVAAFFGCLYAGAVAVPLPAPSLARLRRALPSLREIARDARPLVALTTADTVERIRPLLATEPDLARIAWLAVDEAVDGSRDPSARPQDLAFLQYTSGSTTAPRGVMVSHANLIANEEMIRAAFGQDESSVVVTWLPHFHDMGLIGGLLQPIYVGGTCVAMAPSAFLLKPVRWLRQISLHGATTSGGPGFAYELCAQRIGDEERERLDLSRWRVAFNGAEPVRADTMDRFARVFGPCGFRASAFHPCYGLAEATLLVSGRRSAPEAARLEVSVDDLRADRVVPGAGGPTIVSCGAPDPSTQVAIVDPSTRAACVPGRVGEIWVQGPAVAGGYWGRAELSTETFAAELADGPGRFLRTGDLGFVHQGELYVTGRLKDLLIVRGQNHYPQDIEQTAWSAHPALRPGGAAAFAVADDRGEAIVIVQEIRRSAAATDLEPVAAAIAQAVAQQHELRVDAVALIDASTLPRTSSGKVQRRRCAQQLSAGELAIRHQWRASGAGAPATTAADDTMAAPNAAIVEASTPAPDAAIVEASTPAPDAAIEAFLCRQSGAADPGRPLACHGIDSLRALELAHAVEQRFGKVVAAAWMFEDISIRELAARIADAEDAAAPAAEPEDATHPLTAGQQAMWTACTLAQDSGSYNLAFAVAIRSRADVTCLRKAVGMLVARHPALRTSFEPGDPPRARVHAHVPAALAVIDATGMSEDARRRELARMARRPFDLGAAPLLRAALLAGPEPVLLLVIHHLVADLWSLEVLARDLAALYRAARVGAPAALARPGTFADHCRAQAARAGQEPGREFWKRALDGAETAPLWSDRARTAWPDSIAAARADVAIDGPLRDRLIALARERGATLHTALLAGLAALLRSSGGHQDVMIATPASSRSTAAHRDTIGYFVNVVGVRCPVAATFGALVDDTRRAVAEAFAHQESRHAIGAALQVAFALEQGHLLDPRTVGALALGAAAPPFELGSLVLEPLELPQSAAHFDLTVIARVDGDGLALSMLYRPDRFDGDRIESLARQYARLLSLVAQAPERPLAGLSLVDDDERRRLLAWGTPARDLGCDHVGRAVLAAWARRPRADAVAGLPGAELARRARMVAGWLRARGVQADRRIGLCAPRGEWLPAGALGIWLAGDSFVALDPAHPVDRLRWMLEDAGCAALVGTESAVASLAASRLPVLSLERLHGAEIDEPSFAEIEAEAYVVYTSGSTGRPKGVSVSHAGLWNLVAWHRDRYGVVETDRATLIAAPGFDAAQWEMWPYLAAGATLVPAPDELRSDPQRLAAWLREQSITIAFAPTALAERLVAASSGAGSMRALLCGGEALRDVGVGALPFSLVNHYGPTEATVVATSATVRAEGRTPPIGRPLPNVRAYVLDAELRLVPVGHVGFLHLGGVQVASGYVGRADLTAERFVPDPFGPRGARLYATGDLVAWHGSGELHFLGRRDGQVKIRGHRIELAEVEAALLRQPGVQQAVADVRDDRLVAWVVGEGVDAAGLKAQMRRWLPDSMVPAQIALLPGLPMTPNGKVDRRALATPVAAGRPPRTPMEAIVCEQFAAVLGAAAVSADADFFELGGHSLLATRLQARLRAALGHEVSLRDVFEQPTPAGLARVVEQVRGAPPPPAPAPARRGAVAPALPAQERLWFLAALGAGGPVYNIPAALELRGRLAACALTHALAELVRRHEALRTRFDERGGRPVQVVDAAGRGSVAAVDLGGLAPAARAVEQRRLMRAEARRSFDLARGPLFRARLVRTEEEGHALLLTAHHAAVDGWSMTILGRELGALFAAFAGGAPSPLVEPGLQPADVAVWQRDHLDDEADLAYWRAQLAGAPRLELPPDRPRPPELTHAGARVPVAVPAEVVRRALELAGSERATLFMVLLAAWKATLWRHAQERDLVVGIPIAGRRWPEVDDVVGFLANTLPIRTRLDPDASFAGLVAGTRGACLQAYAHQGASFERIVEQVEQERSLAHAPLVQVMFAVDAAPTLPDLPALAIERIDLDSGVSKVDLTLELVDGGAAGRDGLDGAIEYNPDLFDGERIRRIADDFGRLLAAAVSEPARPLCQLAALGETEAARLDAWAGTCRPIAPGSVPRSVRERAARDPDREAVDGTSYGMLAARAAGLAAWLRGCGVAPERRVALCAERGPALAAGALGIWTAGGSYVALDPSCPRERLGWMLRDSGCVAVVGTTRGLAALPPHGLPTRSLDALDGEALPAAGAPGSEPEPDQEAYVIYTSGSTGTPKGVSITHGGLWNLVTWHREAYGVGGSDRGALISSPGFDASVWELWPFLCAGAALRSVPDEVRLDPDRLVTWMAEHAITIGFAPTALAERMAAREDWPAGLAQRALVTGGEALREVGGSPLPFALVNEYGPTECTVVATASVVRGRPAIGRPVDNVGAHVLDRAMRRVPIGAPGELHLGGAQVARGYVARPSLTAERFVPDPFGAPGARLYRTGDRVRWRGDGELEFLGRGDHQVKLRGHRIELGEVEAALLAQPGVEQAAAAVRGARLVAWVAGGPVDRSALASWLPDYMVPAAIVSLAELPLTANGKIDRRALVEPAAPARSAAGSPTEELVAHLMADLLGAGEIGARDDFFERGGHSLLATQLLARVRDATGVEIPLRELFAAPTPAALASAVDSALRAGAASVAPPMRIPRRDRSSAPLSSAQERIWFLEHLDPGGPVFHMAGAVELRGALRAAALAAALAQVLDRHDGLRTGFEAHGGEPRAHTRERVDLRLRRVDLSQLAGDRRSEAADGVLRAAAERAFDLASPPLARALLVRLGPTEHRLGITLHHIVADGWSIGVLLRDVSRAHDAIRRGEPAALPALPIQVGDHAAWQAERLRGDAFAADLAFWRDTLRDAPALDLPTDRPRQQVQTHRGGRVPVAFTAAESAEVRALCRRLGATPFMVVTAAFQALLNRYTGQTDVVVGTLVAGRTRVELEELIGLFVNALALRTDLSGAPSFAALVARAREVVLAACAHQDAPFERVVDAVQPARDLGRSPIFQAMVLLQNTPPETLRLEGLTLRDVPVDLDVAVYDLTLSLSERDGGLDGSLQYNADLFEPATAERMAVHFRRLLLAAIREPDRAIDRISVLDERERALLVEDHNDTARPWPLQAGLIEELAGQAARRPAAIAAVDDGAAISYAELHRRARAFAGALAAAGVAREDIVPVLGARGVDLLVAMLAVFHAGAGYLPLDPKSPPARWQQIIEASGAGVALASPELAAQLERAAGATCRVRRLDEVAGTSAVPLTRATEPVGLAYAIFTSGSTGTPKGAMVHHRGMLNHILAKVETLRLGPADVVAQTASQCFDISIWQFLAPLVVGGSARIYDDATALEPARLLARCAADGVTVLEVVPSLLRALVDELDDAARCPPLSLRWLMATGEALPPDLVRRWLAHYPRIPVVNAFGPTECSDDVAQHALEVSPPAGAVHVPVGAPLANTQLYVLDESLGLVPVGAPGELYVGGVGVGRGYLREPARTAQAFIPDPFARDSGARLYRTGDRARWRDGGVVEFLGRLDHQVKLRGFRIELAEIEVVLRRHPDVRDAAALLRDGRLIAYVVGAADPAALRAHARDHLPEYMVPTTWVPLPALPTTASGKLDRGRLPQPPGEAHAGAGQAVVPPRTATEREVAAIWVDVLGVAALGTEQRFFDVGGDSLKLVRVYRRLCELYPGLVTIVELFQHATVADISRCIDKRRGRAEAPALEAFEI